ncbi:MAG: DUF4105 domain-containing protein [Treponema sp.]|nr:DUF4105 domain-containing protein [Treponema sp.]
MKKIALFILLFCIFTIMLSAQGENLTVKVAILGPGDPLYFWWGHIALVIEDSNTGRSLFYDYGIFSFDSEHFFYNFAFGRLLYSSGVSLTAANIEFYRRNNRSLAFYTLNFPPETRLKVKEIADSDMLPENREYSYHHFRNNCSTRIIEIIDLATDGQFKEKFDNMQSRFTLREHVRRHIWFSPAPNWFLNFLMGQLIDRPITVWDDMFLPSEVAKNIMDFWYTDVNGVQRKLVASEDSIQEIIESGGRPVVLEFPKSPWFQFLTFSIGLSVVFGFFFFLYHKNIRVGRILAGISMSLCGLFFGLAGLLLYFMNICTDHDYTYQNANMFFCTPLLLAAFPAGIRYAFTKNPQKLVNSSELLRLLWLMTVIGIFISMVVKIFPSCPINNTGFYQQNLAEQMLMLPLALLFTFQPVGLKACLEKIFMRKRI